MSKPKFDALNPAGFLVFEWEMLSDAMRGLDTRQLCVYCTIHHVDPNGMFSDADARDLGGK